MKIERGYPIYTVTPKAENAIVKGHPWVYDAEILNTEGETVNGGLVDVVSKKGRYLGTGFLSQHSKIRVRLISRNANDRFDEAFWRRKLQWAWDYRKSVMDPADLDACRVIFGEADAFPGLTVDKFHDLLSVQVLSVGMENLQDLLLPALVDILRRDGQPIRGVFLRNDVALRDKEGLPQGKGWYALPGETPPDSPVVEIVENRVKYLVDVENGQKTGFFLDQKYNRRAVGRLAAGKTVLDCFTHTGSFALNAALGGPGQRGAQWRIRYYGLRGGQCVRPAAPAGKGAGEVRFHHPGPACFHQEPENRGQCHHRLQGDQLPGHEAAAPGRVLGHLLLLPLRHSGEI